MNKSTTLDLIEDLRALGDIAGQAARRRDIVFSFTDGDILHEAADEIDILFNLCQQMYVALMTMIYVPYHTDGGTTLSRACNALDEFDRFNKQRNYYEEDSTL